MTCVVGSGHQGETLGFVAPCAGGAAIGKLTMAAEGQWLAFGRVEFGHMVSESPTFLRPREET